VVIVANAGVSGPKAEPDQEDAGELKDKLWQNETVEQWNETYSTDVTSVYFTTVAFLPLLQASMKPKGPGEKFSANVITTSSMSGIMRHAQGHFAYVQFDLHVEDISLPLLVTVTTQPRVQLCI